MKWSIKAMAIAAVVLFASCKNKSTGDNTTDTTSTTNTNITTNEGSMNPAIEVPATMRTTFEEKYPQASNVQWNYYRPVEPYYIDWEWTGWPTFDTMDYVVNYNWQGTDYMSWYDDQGNWVGTINTVNDHNSLPAAVNDMIKKQYSGYTISSVKMENDKNRTAYEISLDNGNGSSGKLLVDENGKILKKKINTMSKEKMNPKDSAQ